MSCSALYSPLRLLDGIATDVGAHQLPGERRPEVLQLELGEARPLQRLPALSSQVAPVKQQVPGRMQDLLPKVNPG